MEWTNLHRVFGSRNDVSFVQFQFCGCTVLFDLFNFFFFFTILFLLCSPIINKNLLEARLFFFFYAVEKDCSNMNHFTTILFQVIN